MKQYIILLVMLLSSFVAFPFQENSDNNELPSEVVKSIENRIEEGLTPSIALAIIDSTGIQYFNFGLTATKGKKVNENTIYEIGSISKAFTGILLAQQVLDEELQLEDKINDFLPHNIKIPTKGLKEITFGNLSDHTSGLPRMPDNFKPANPYNPYADYTVEQMYDFISNYKPIRAVGATYEYSNLAQGLLGHLLALNKNSNYEDLVIQTIAAPLGMMDTKITFTKKMLENLALGHAGGKQVENWDIPTLAGAGAIRSSTSDMSKFIAANLGYVKSPIAEAMELSHKVRHHKAGEMSVALGWHIKNGELGDVIWHNGGTGGYRAFSGFVKETGKGVVLLSNSTADIDDIGFHLLDPGTELIAFPSKKDAVEIPESTLERYVGLYELQPKFTITITNEGNQLFGQATGQDRFKIYPENDTTFYLTVVKAKITFQLKNDTVESLTLFQGGQEIKGKKIK